MSMALKLPLWTLNANLYLICCMAVCLYVHTYVFWHVLLYIKIFVTTTNHILAFVLVNFMFYQKCILIKDQHISETLLDLFMIWRISDSMVLYSWLSYKCILARKYRIWVYNIYVMFECATLIWDHWYYYYNSTLYIMYNGKHYKISEKLVHLKTIN